MADFMLRNATMEDATAMARVESQSWPAELASSEQQIRDRIRVYSAGQWIAERDDQIVGVVFAQRIIQSFLDQTLKTYDLLTDRGCFTNSHRPDGEIYQLVSVGVSPSCRGAHLGRQLVDRQLEFARSLKEICRIIGFTRPDRYQSHSELAMDEYLKLRRADGRLVDPTIAFHVEAGAQLVSTHAGYRPEDAQARGYGVLIEYRKME